jgi:cytochrome c oxidase subunit IV
MSQPVEHMEPAEAEELSHHPQPKQYVIVAVVLAVVTAAEVAIYYISALQDLIIPFLIAFSLIKFILVALWFMHLRFDSRVFRRFFVTGIVLAILIFTVVLVFYATHGGPAPGVSS